MKENQQLTSDERYDVMKQCNRGINGVHIFDDNWRNHDIPENYKKIPINEMYPDIEEMSKKLKDLKHEHARKTL